MFHKQLLSLTDLEKNHHRSPGHKISRILAAIAIVFSLVFDATFMIYNFYETHVKNYKYYTHNFPTSTSYSPEFKDLVPLFAHFIVVWAIAITVSVLFFKNSSIKETFGNERPIISLFNKKT